MRKLVAGIDEAGRGPVLGPLVLAGVLIEEEKTEDLVRIGVKDSKLLTPKRRVDLSRIIEGLALKLLQVEISPEQIDNRIKRGISLNRLEAEKIASLINRLCPDKVYIDCPDTNPDRFAQWLRNHVKPKRIEILAMHHADENIPVVSAASIMAKVRRDQRIRELKEKLGEIGSGYTSDGKTRQYIAHILRENDSSDNMPNFVRKTWKTIKNIRSSINSSNDDST
ncbi:MAG: ribonuclease HII [Candidatus Atabeyarchaeum deiterrae]|jgi:ribonuclease HII